MLSVGKELTGFIPLPASPQLQGAGAWTLQGEGSFTLGTGWRIFELNCELLRTSQGDEALTCASDDVSPQLQGGEVWPYSVKNSRLLQGEESPLDDLQD